MPNSQGQLSSTSQKYLEILDITNDLLVMKDGSTAVVLEVSAINFGLLSEPEQDAIIYAYAALINSLSFPIQIAIISRPKDVSNYLEYVDEQFQTATSDLRRQQIASYRQFVSNLITEQNVLDKNFYVILPLSAIELGIADSVNPMKQVMPSDKPAEFDKNSVIQRSVNTLGPRRDHMISQFSRFGLRAEQLRTKDLIQLFYIMYNSQSAEGIKVVDTKEYTSAVIQPRGNFQVPTAAPEVATAPPTQTTPAAPEPTPPAASAPQAVPVEIPSEDTTSEVSSLENAMSSIPREGVGLNVDATNTDDNQPPR
ncbi:hypothetical protein LRY65_00805 [Candidatus Woesebacteria bacterium]|nr:hypothetical protein [Candidatus Woesebacteria bacterium]MCD8507680.1 hypothetical protein [Candidatus Woesebacteria bacterium]MCD8526737.1 hypothetical protein [Candidatus Woesebacteria bacterium]MCD8546520.1 hypothetical protein [Candidatus Woesebacteria bacterium]